jgi:hypothetical protein
LLNKISPCALTLHLNVSPLALLEAQNGQQASRHVAHENRRPYAGGLKVPGAGERKANAERDEQL